MLAHEGRGIPARLRGPAARWGLKARVFRLWQSDGAIRTADQVLCLSTEDRRYIEALGVAPERVTAFVNGVGSEFVDVPRVAGGQRVLFVGGWFDIKGRRVLPSLWAKVVSLVPAARLTVAGTHASEAEVLREFAPDVRETVTVKPRVDASHMPALFGAHDVFLMPSLLEGSPLVIARRPVGSSSWLRASEESPTSFRTESTDCCSSR